MSYGDTLDLVVRALGWALPDRMQQGSLPVERRDAGQPVHRGQTRCVLLACTDEEPPVTRLVGTMQRP